MPTRLDGKTAVVTGGTRRIGREIALALAREGADVAITYRTSQEDALRTAKEIEDTGRRALAAQCDVRSEASVQATVSSINAAFGRQFVSNNTCGMHIKNPK